MSERSLSFGENLVAGGFSGFCFIFCSYPIDLLKTLYQAQSFDYRTLKRENIFGLWRGSLFPVLLGAASGMTYFTLIEGSRDLLRKRLGQSTLSAKSEFIAGAATGFVAGVIQNFVDVVKINLQVYRGGNLNSLQFLRQTLQQHAYRMYLRPLFLSAVTKMWATGVFLSTYFHTYKQFPPHSNYTGLICGGLAGLISWNASFLLDTLRTLMISSRQSVSWVELVRQVVFMDRQTLINVYLLGLLRAVVSGGCSFFAYDLASKFIKADRAK